MAQSQRGEQFEKQPAPTKLVTENLNEAAYSNLLGYYLDDIKNQEVEERERQKMYLLEKSFTYSKLDIIFPYHMYLGKLELQKKQESDQDYSFTTLKTFVRRRQFLIWLFNSKVQSKFTEEEKERRNEAERIVFKWDIIMKAVSGLLLLNLKLFYKRPVGRSWWFDIMILYGSTYAFLLSNVVGVYYTWPLYEDLVQKMLKQQKKIKAEAIMDNTELDSFKCYYYQQNMKVARFI